MSLVAMELPTQDCLTGFEINSGTCRYYPEWDGLEYISKPVGLVRIDASSFISIQDEKEDRMILSGICRASFENKQEPPVIISSCVRQIFEKFDHLIPKTFEDKKRKILEYLILNGGKEYHETNIYFETDFPLVFGDKDELYRVMRSLIDDNFITVKAPNKSGYFRTLPTKEGIKFAEDVGSKTVGFLYLLTEKETIYSLVGSGEVKQLLQFIKNITKSLGTQNEIKTVTLLEAGFNAFQNEKIKGFLTREEERVATMKLFDKIMSLIEPS